MVKLTLAGFVDFSFLPHAPIGDVSEMLEWSTDVVTSQNGSEDVTSNRAVPRQSFRYDIAAGLLDRQTAFDLLEQNIRGKWALPLWTDAQYVGLVSGATVVCNTLTADFRVGGLALAYMNNANWQLRRITAKTDTSITVDVGFSGVANAHIVPVLGALLSGSVANRFNGTDSTYTLTFNMLDSKAPTPAADPSPLYNSVPIMVTEPDSGGEDVGKSIMKREDRIDFGGAFAVRSPWTYSRLTTMHGFTLADIDEVMAFKRMLYKRAGRASKFYLPTFQYDVQLSSIASDKLSAVILRKDFNAYNMNRNTFAIKWDDGSWQGVGLVSFVDAGSGNVTLNFLTALRGTIAQVRQMSYMGLARFDTDRVELQWIGNKVVRASIPMVEISK